MPSNVNILTHIRLSGIKNDILENQMILGQQKINLRRDYSVMIVVFKLAAPIYNLKQG